MTSRSKISFERRTGMWRVAGDPNYYDRRSDAERAARRPIGRVNLPGQMELPQTEERPAEVAKLKSAESLKPQSPQKPCDIGLFSDQTKQIDLEDLL